jgi:hypothetical protein
MEWGCDRGENANAKGAAECVSTPPPTEALRGPPPRYWTHFTGNHYRACAEAERGADWY